MGDFFGHAVPGTFYILMALFLYIWAWIQFRRDPTNARADATVGSSAFRKTAGWTVVVISGLGLMLESVGGVLLKGEVFFQSAHQTMYLGFFITGVLAVLEAAGKLRDDAWRVSLSAAFFVEGCVFYGHQLEQTGNEAALHFIMVCMSMTTAAMFAWAVSRPTEILPHLLGISGMLLKGIWFFVIARILYSGKFGPEGDDYMVGDMYTTVGFLVLVVLVLHACAFGRQGMEPQSEAEHSHESTPFAGPEDIESSGKRELI